MALQRTRRPRFRSDRSLRSLGSPLNARSLGSRRLLAPLAVLLALGQGSCLSSSPPELMLRVTSAAGRPGVFTSGEAIFVEALDRARICNTCFLSGAKYEVLRGSTIIESGQFGPFPGTGRATVGGTIYCSAGLTRWLREHGKYWVRLSCPDGRTATSAEFEVAQRQ